MQLIKRLIITLKKPIQLSLCKQNRGAKIRGGDPQLVQTINAIEKGKFDPSLALAFKISRLFGLTVEDIFLDD